MSPGVPYVSVRSNDVLNGSLDLVLRLCTHVDAVWRVLRPDREVRIFLLDPLLILYSCRVQRRVPYILHTAFCTHRHTTHSDTGIRNSVKPCIRPSHATFDP